jgi:hypothetical protein
MISSSESLSPTSPASYAEHNRWIPGLRRSINNKPNPDNGF